MDRDECCRYLNGAPMATADMEGQPASMIAGFTPKTGNSGGFDARTFFQDLEKFGR